MTSKNFKGMWLTPKRDAPVEWWYLGSDKYYHYMVERWGISRKAWKIRITELLLNGIDLHRPKAGDDAEVGFLLHEHNLPAGFNNNSIDQVR